MIILELGTNDLANLSPDVVGSEIEELVSLLLETFSVRVIGVCHVVPRGISFAMCDRFLQGISYLRQYLSVVLAFPQVFCWTHSYFSSLSKPFYLADGVHLNTVGQYLLYRNCRGAILKALAPVNFVLFVIISLYLVYLTAPWTTDYYRVICFIVA